MRGNNAHIIRVKSALQAIKMDMVALGKLPMQTL